ncbi:MAG: hypothetical protein JWO20_1592 [Candidatus Angelobacter sp.]|jgi:uncharacterized membrane protein YoaK (UPF0700 family)|nr:hypothetical protein [Candidatus Angelobacter sp.]
MKSESSRNFHDRSDAFKVRDLLLNALAVSSGAVDAISYLSLGKVFSAFMTGNIAFLGLRIAGAGGPGKVAILVAMIAFAVGVYISARVVRPTEGSGVWPQRVTVALSISLIPHAAFVAVWFASNGQPSINVSHVLLGVWGIAMGMQSAAVRNLHVEGVFTTAATATIIVLVSDFANWSVTAAERRRLAGILVSLFVGATAGGLLLVHAQIYAPVLPFAITLATVATAAIVMRERDNNRLNQLDLLKEKP